MPWLGFCKNLHVFDWIHFSTKSQIWNQEERQDRRRHLGRIRVALFSTFQYFTRLMDGGRATVLFYIWAFHCLWTNVTPHVNWVICQQMCQQIWKYELKINRWHLNHIANFAQYTSAYGSMFREKPHYNLSNSFWFCPWWEAFVQHCFLQTCLTGLSTWQAKQGDVWNVFQFRLLPFQMIVVSLKLWSVAL